MKTLRSFVSVPLALLLCFPVSAYADDVSNLAGLLDEPVVSTASRTAETAGLAPATTSVITAEDLRRHGIGSLDEAINFLALGMIAEPSYGTPEIGTRGVLLSGDYGNHVLLLVDGHAVNEPWDGTAYYDRSAAVPMDLVDHIEVILGPGSVLYGSSAMLGVINVITKRAKDYPGLHLVADGGYPASGRAAGGYGTEFELMGRQGELTAGVLLFLGLCTRAGALIAIWMNLNYLMMKGWLNNDAFNDRTWIVCHVVVFLTGAGLVAGLDGALSRFLPSWLTGAERGRQPAPAPGPEPAPEPAPSH